MISVGMTLAIIIAGVIVVVGGVLGLRLHAFLALVFGALVVGGLTPSSSIAYHELSRDAIHVFSVENVSADTKAIGEQYAFQFQVKGKPDFPTGTALTLLRPDPQSGEFVKLASLTTQNASLQRPNPADAQVASQLNVATDVKLEWQESDILVSEKTYKSAQATAGRNVGERIADGFGSTCANIGIIIAMASIIGKCLLDSGAADRVVRSSMKLLGERGAPLAFLLSGFLLGIPVFFDTVFYLMIPLGKACQLRTGRNYLLYVLTIVAGASMAHSLVPPTPGPLFVAEQLKVDLGVMILGGCLVGLFTSAFGYLYAVLINRKFVLPLRESADMSLVEMEAAASRDERELPPLWMAVLPIILPVVLIGGVTILRRQPLGLTLSPAIMNWAETLGDKNIALVISAVIALLMLVWNNRVSRHEVAKSVQAALSSGGTIILITAAGGAFGKVLQQTGVAGLIRDLPQSSPPMLILLAFLITAAVRTAQGSATVAMITAVGILSGLATGGNLGFHPVYLALAIGCGSKPIPWMNDSGFWVITKMSGMTEGECLKYVTPMSTGMGLMGLAVIMTGVVLFPMA